MKKLLILTIVSTLSLFLNSFIVQAQTKKPAKPTVRKSTVKSAPKSTIATTGLLYKISGKGLKQPSYIFGTVHIICEKDMFPMDKLTGYIDKAQQLVMEVDMDDQAEMGSFVGAIMLPEGKTFTEYLTPEETSKLDELTKSTLGVGVEQVKSIKPIMLQTMIVANPKALGCSPPSSYEMSFVNTAKEKSKPIIGLETVKFQSEMLDKMPLEKQAKGLAKIAQDPQKAYDNFHQLMKIYKLQDSTALYAELEKQSVDNKEFTAELIDSRNKTWIPLLEKEMKAHPSFIAVGGGHLGGTAGVLKLLKAKGYTVTPIKL